ncbi:hypothetical protein R1sor_019964 [Riccia sorocarpa]|uniref:CS domain-containing protein n=1 Tax=Riccia sorocarpa TaxID=122646 RepID=A0ABD3IE63_9MARC
MPITPAYAWHEAMTSISVDIKIRAVTQSSADILMTDCYIKVNCTPHFFEADLYGEIDARKSSASVGQDAVKFFLIKDREDMPAKLSNIGRLAVGEQMKLEEARRKAIEEKKKKELSVEQVP